jgi:hypothetical protein
MSCSSNENDGGDIDEFDVDMTPGDEVVPDLGVDYLGTYPSFAAFLRSQVEHLMVPEGLWLLDCIDYDAVLRALEAGIYRIWRTADGQVFRRRLGGG